MKSLRKKFGAFLTIFIAVVQVAESNPPKFFDEKMGFELEITAPLIANLIPYLDLEAMRVKYYAVDALLKDHDIDDSIYQNIEGLRSLPPDVRKLLLRDDLKVDSSPKLIRTPPQIIRPDLDRVEKSASTKADPLTPPSNRPQLLTMFGHPVTTSPHEVIAPTDQDLDQLGFSRAAPTADRTWEIIRERWAKLPRSTKLEHFKLSWLKSERIADLLRTSWPIGKADIELLWNDSAPEELRTLVKGLRPHRDRMALEFAQRVPSKTFDEMWASLALLAKYAGLDPRYLFFGPLNPDLQLRRHYFTLHIHYSVQNDEESEEIFKKKSEVVEGIVRHEMYKLGIRDAWSLESLFRVMPPEKEMEFRYLYLPPRQFIQKYAGLMKLPLAELEIEMGDRFWSEVDDFEFEQIFSHTETPVLETKSREFKLVFLRFLRSDLRTPPADERQRAIDNAAETYLSDLQNIESAYVDSIDGEVSIDRQLIDELEKHSFTETLNSIDPSQLLTLENLRLRAKVVASPTLLRKIANLLVKRRITTPNWLLADPAFSKALIGLWDGSRFVVRQNLEQDSFFHLLLSDDPLVSSARAAVTPSELVSHPSIHSMRPNENPEIAKRILNTPTLRNNLTVQSPAAFFALSIALEPEAVARKSLSSQEFWGIWPREADKLWKALINDDKLMERFAAHIGKSALNAFLRKVSGQVLDDSLPLNSDKIAALPKKIRKGLRPRIEELMSADDRRVYRAVLIIAESRTRRLRFEEVLDLLEVRDYDILPSAVDRPGYLRHLEQYEIQKIIEREFSDVSHRRRKGDALRHLISESSPFYQSALESFIMAKPDSHVSKEFIREHIFGNGFKTEPSEVIIKRALSSHTPPEPDLVERTFEIIENEGTVRWASYEAGRDPEFARYRYMRDEILPLFRDGLGQWIKHGQIDRDRSIKRLQGIVEEWNPLAFEILESVLEPTDPKILELKKRYMKSDRSCRSLIRTLEFHPNFESPNSTGAAQ